MDNDEVAEMVLDVMLLEDGDNTRMWLEKVSCFSIVKI